MLDADPSTTGPDSTTRRRFLRATAAAVVPALFGAARGDDGVAAAVRAVTSSTTAPAADAGATAQVVETNSEYVISGQTVQPNALDEMLSVGLQQLTRTESTPAAWNTILRPDDVIGIKFNSSGAASIGTTPVFAGVLLRSLVLAGFDPARIVMIEEGGATRPSVRTARPELRYSDRMVDFGCGSDAFIGFVEQVTAIINVPFLKTHHTAVMTSCLKNLSHGLIRHPARFHSNGCDPAIARIVASEPVRSRLRLNIVNALRVVTDGGPRARADDILNFGGLLFSTDPVAADAIGFEILNLMRALRKLPPLLVLPTIPPQLVTAARLGLGQADTERIRWRRTTV